MAADEVSGMKLIPIRMTKAVLYLTEDELVSLLSRDPALWAASIRRGKAIRRAAATEKRELQHIGEILPGLMADIERRRL